MFGHNQLRIGELEFAKTGLLSGAWAPTATSQL